MAGAAPESLEERLAQLERQVRELRARVAALEAATRTGVEHPGDRAVVREKATYDWQAPR